MARIVPTDIAWLDLAGANRHEIATLRVLQTRLPDNYRVFHGVHWTREWASETILPTLPIGPRAWCVRQVQRALDNVRDKFRRTQGGGRAIELDYLILLVPI